MFFKWFSLILTILMVLFFLIYFLHANLRFIFVVSFMYFVLFFMFVSESSFSAISYELKVPSYLQG
jgi:hypothetical protein